MWHIAFCEPEDGICVEQQKILLKIFLPIYLSIDMCRLKLNFDKLPAELARLLPLICFLDFVQGLLPLIIPPFKEV